MALLFSDTLQVSGGSGTYTLMGKTNGAWQYIHSMSGTTDGNIDISAALNSIPLDTAIYVPGRQYAFKWIDSNGSESNVAYITIPADVAITDYVAGMAHMDFTPAGGGADSYTVSFYGHPDSFQSMHGATQTGFHYQIEFCVAGVKTPIEENDTAPADYSRTLNGYGAGTYHIIYGYEFDNGLFFINYNAFMVDAHGTILASIMAQGSTVSNVNGLTLDVASHINTYNYTPSFEAWAAYDDTTPTFLLMSASGTVTMLPDSVALIHGIDAGSVFTDLGPDDGAFIYNRLTIG